MILRRLSEAIRRQDPATVTVELLVLIVGIALGLQVDQWNDQRKQRQLEQTLIDRLYVDFEQIEQRLIGSIDQYEDFLSAIVEVRDQVQSNRPPASEEERRRFQDALGDVMASRIPAGRSPTYVEMLSTGAFNALSDVELKRSLVAYDRSQSVAMIGWQSLRDQAIQFSEPILYALTLAPPPEDRDNVFPVAFDFERMRSDPQFDAALGVQISVQANNQELQEVQLVATRAALERLKPGGGSQ
jgi:hypothetical protein